MTVRSSPAIPSAATWRKPSTTPAVSARIPQTIAIAPWAPARGRGWTTASARAIASGTSPDPTWSLAAVPGSGCRKASSITARATSAMAARKTAVARAVRRRAGAPRTGGGAGARVGRSRTSGIPQRLAGLEAHRPAQRRHQDDDGEHDRPDQRDRDVHAREGERQVQLGGGLGQPDDRVGEAVPESHTERPAQHGDDQPLGGEDPPDVAAAGPDAPQHPDLARPLEDAHRDRVDQPDHADGHDDE